MRLADLTSGTSAGWAGLRVVVAGIGISGFAAADALLERGAQVVVIDPRDDQAQRERGIVLDTLGARVRLGADAPADLPAVDGGNPDLLVVSPGWAPDHPLVAAALAAGPPVWSEAELAWRMRPEILAAPWLTVTGTRGKATTTTMLASMLRAAGLRATATGQAGTSLLEAVLHPDPYQVLAVQLSTAQLRWAESVRPAASVCLNVFGDDLTGDRAELRGRIYRNTELACVYNLADPRTEQLVRDAEVIEGCRAIGVGLGVPSVSDLGLVEDVLCDRAFVPERRTSAAELGELADVRTAWAGVLAPHNVFDALAAAALARAFGAPPIAVRDGLRGYRPLPHRLYKVAEVSAIDYVDDSAATDPAAAAAGLTSFEQVVWIAGGVLAEEADELVRGVAGRLRACLLLGESPRLREALERHAPDVPVVEVPVADTGPMQLMQAVVEHAGELAQPGDTVLLSPAAHPAPPFRSLDERGAAFVAAVLDLNFPAAADDA
jgi:UDP-N-acetylmuramoylalanine--D-glutamate ligase